MLTIFGTTMAHMDSVLWPFLLECVLDKECWEGTGIIFKVLAVVAERKRTTEAPDYLLDFDHFVNLPKPQQILARFLVSSLFSSSYCFFCVSMYSIQHVTGGTWQSITPRSCDSECPPLSACPRSCLVSRFR